MFKYFTLERSVDQLFKVFKVKERHIDSVLVALLHFPEDALQTAHITIVHNGAVAI